MVRFHRSLSRPAGSIVRPNTDKARQNGKSRLIDTVWIIPMRMEATNAPQIEPSPPITTTANTMAPSEAAIPGWVVNALPAITPARPARPQPAPKTSVNTRGTSWPSMDTMSGWVSAARTIRPSRVRDRAANNATNIASETAIMNTR